MANSAEGIFFQRIEGDSAYLPEYSADAFNYDLYEKTNDIATAILFTYTDIPNLENIVCNMTSDDLDVDLFETATLKDAFLMTLKYLLSIKKIQ